MSRANQDSHFCRKVAEKGAILSSIFSIYSLVHQHLIRFLARFQLTREGGFEVSELADFSVWTRSFDARSDWSNLRPREFGGFQLRLGRLNCCFDADWMDALVVRTAVSNGLALGGNDQRSQFNPRKVIVGGKDWGFKLEFERVVVR
ncbi:hypothetical protein ACLOJK_014450 [Asimina triloba]